MTNDSDDEPPPVPSPPPMSVDVHPPSLCYTDLLAQAKELAGWYVATSEDCFDLFRYENQMVSIIDQTPLL